MEWLLNGESIQNGNLTQHSGQIQSFTISLEKLIMKNKAAKFSTWIKTNNTKITCAKMVDEKCVINAGSCKADNQTQPEPYPS